MKFDGIVSCPFFFSLHLIHHCRNEAEEDQGKMWVVCCFNDFFKKGGEV